jgi:hypothetical protein
MKDGQKSWADFPFTDPQSDDARKFAFIVHSIDPSGKDHKRLLESQIEQGVSEYDESQDINLFENPERISDKKQISCSLIGRDCDDVGRNIKEVLGTMRRVGFILKVPAENILQAAPCDSGNRFDENNHNKICTPKELLNHDYRYSNEHWNEILAQGKTENGGTVEIVGIFMCPHWIKPKYNQEIIDRFTNLNNQIEQWAAELSKRVGKPIFRVPEYDEILNTSNKSNNIKQDKANNG